MNAEEYKRYSRHLVLKDWTPQQQNNLKSARVLYIGAGGLGCATLPLLAAAGVGQLTIVDGDVIELSNLQRQLAFTENDIGNYKATVLKNYLQQRNGVCQVQALTQFFTEDHAHLIAEHDLVAIGTDNFESRLLLNRLCVQHQKPAVFTAVSGFEGQLFCMDIIRKTPCYQCFNPPTLKPVNPADTGVFNAMVSTAGAQQPAAILQYIRFGKFQQAGILKVFNLDSISQYNLKIDQNCAVCS